MDSELEEFVKKSLMKKTFADKIRRRLLLLKAAKINEMRKTLIKEAKPVFALALTVNNKDPAFNKLLIEHFDERIRTLPKENILELYSELQDLKSAKSDEARGYILSHLILHINILYGLEGWFRKKVARLITS